MKIHIIQKNNFFFYKTLLFSANFFLIINIFFRKKKKLFINFEDFSSFKKHYCVTKFFFEIKKILIKNYFDQKNLKGIILPKKSIWENDFVKSFFFFWCVWTV